MQQNVINVQIGDSIEHYPEGTSYREIAEKHQMKYNDDIVLVFANDKLQELHNTLNQDAVIQFVTTGDEIGHNAYVRSMTLLLVKAFYDVCDHSPELKVRVQFSLSDGLYCTVEGIEKVDQMLLDQVKDRMWEMIDRDIPINKRTVHTEDSVDLFNQYGMSEKKRLFKYRTASNVNLYRINEFEDYFYGYMVPSTGYLRYFELYQYDEGLVLQLPVRKNPKQVRAFRPADKLFRVLKDSMKWGDMQHIESVGALNDMIAMRDPQETILVQEAYQERKIAQIAEMISANPKVKFILIAGPSSSGKTTFSHRLSIQLKANGMVPHPIAVDNFFVEREMTPRDENGEYNFECLGAMDIDLFGDCMSRLLRGEEVVLPTFNFKTGHKEYLDKPKKLGESDVLVIEGIHCLNPEMTRALPDENKFKIYISALTQLNVDEHNRIPTTDGRLFRRIVRDARTRGKSAKNTIAMWDSVRRGEEENIFPYQEEADVMFNSSLIYELAVLKQYVEPLLFGIERDCPEYYEAKRLLKFLDYFVGIGSENVPANSLLREFIGGGCFRI